jgi:hypothetical protein
VAAEQSGDHVDQAYMILKFALSVAAVIAGFHTFFTLLVH